MVRPLTTADQRRLVSALLELDGMRKRSTREIIVSALERELGHRIPVVRHEQDLFDVWGLVDACLLYPGAVRTLVFILDTFHRGSRPMTEIRGLVDELLPEPLLDAQERRGLNRLVAELVGAGITGVRHVNLAAMYRDAVGPIGPSLNHNGHDLSAVIAQLEEVTADVEGIPPLLRFLERLATYLEKPIAAELQSWVDGFAMRHNIDAGNVRQIRASATRTLEAPQASAYLVVEFAPDGVDPDCFLLSAWLQYGDEPGLTLSRDDRLLRLSELPAQVTDLLIEDHVIHRVTSELTIEFVLPRRLLGQPVDQWRITIEGLERRLGIEYPVIVRSLDRLHQRGQHHNWRRKWARLRDNPGTTTVCRITRPGETGGEGLYNALLYEPSSVCLALAFPPSPDRQSIADELEVGLQAGVPVIVWCRDQREPARFEAELQRLLDMGLFRLPESTLLLRRQAVQAQKAEEAEDGVAHLGFHLTLVFDDADRVPEPYVRLSPPV